MIDVAGLKVGDTVGVGGFGEECPVKKVARRTATQVILDDGSRWSKTGKRIAASGYSGAWLMPEQEANERNADALKRRQHNELIRQVREIALRGVSNDGLLMMLQVAKDHAL